MTNNTATDQESRFLDIHVLLSSPYANLNRDDTGSPKTCHIGGVERARVSSQCQKRAARLAMTIEGATRTRKLPASIAEALAKAPGGAWSADQAHIAAAGVLAAHGFEPYKNDLAETSILTFLPDNAGKRIAGAILDQAASLVAVIEALPPADDAKAATENAKALGLALAGRKSGAKDSAPFKVASKAAADAVSEHLPNRVREALHSVVEYELGRVNPAVALFGRMLTAMPDTNVDGAAQVAHAFSTHAADIDTDYFTAVDDLNAAAEPGAGMIGTPDYVSAVYYRRAVIDIDDLRKNLKGDRVEAAAAAAAFADAFAKSISDAKKTSCGPPPRPSLVLVVARSDTPVSYCNAFEHPVPAATEGGYLLPSAKRLLEEAGGDRDDPGINGAWLFLAPSTASDLTDSAGDLFSYTVVTLHSLEDAIRAGLSS